MRIRGLNWGAMRPETSATIDQLSATLTSIEKVMDPETLRETVR